MASSVEYDDDEEYPTSDTTVIIMARCVGRVTMDDQLLNEQTEQRCSLSEIQLPTDFIYSKTTSN